MSKDCCSPKDNKTKIKGVSKVDPFIMWIGIITVVVLVGAVIFGSKMGEGPAVSANSEVSMEVGDKTYDWGTIDYDGGMATKTFEIKNTSGKKLQLYNVKTSCMCTTAQLISGDNKSKKFGMHETSKSVFEVEPGATAELLVEFDPAFHGPSGTGPITRTITIETNDKSNPSLSFNLTGTVVKN